MSRTIAWDEITVVQENTHVGRAITRNPEAWAGQIRSLQPDVVFLCEVSPAAWNHLVHLCSKDYWISPRADVHYRGREPHQIVVMARKSTFPTFLSASNRLVLGWAGGGKGGRLHPNRNLPVLRVKDQYGRIYRLTGVHTWAAQKAARIKAGFDTHVAAIAASLHLTLPETVSLAAGDWNQNLKQPSYVSRVLGRLGCQFASDALNDHPTTSHDGGSQLDDVAFRRRGFLHAVSHRAFDIQAASDHYGLLTKFRVHRLK